MPNCSVVGCGIRKSENRPNLSLHRLPKNYRKRKMWLDTIGVENLKSCTKTIFVCSLHFDESCFNRTLNITTLREDAVPSRIFLPPAQSSTSSTISEIDPNQTPYTYKCDASDEVKNVSSYTVCICQNPIPSTSNQSISNLPVPDATLETVTQLNLKCKNYQKKIKTLNEKIRRKKKKIVAFSNIIKDLIKSHGR